MIYVALIGMIAFTAFFVWELTTSLKAGVVSSRGWSASRETQPVSFWLGMLAWAFNAVVGAAATLMILVMLITGHGRI